MTSETERLLLKANLLPSTDLYTAYNTSFTCKHSLYSLHSSFLLDDLRPTKSTTSWYHSTKNQNRLQSLPLRYSQSLIINIDLLVQKLTSETPPQDVKSLPQPTPTSETSKLNRKNRFPANFYNQHKTLAKRYSNFLKISFRILPTIKDTQKQWQWKVVIDFQNWGYREILVKTKKKKKKVHNNGSY